MVESFPKSNNPLDSHREKEINLDDVYLFGRALRKIIETSGKSVGAVAREMGVSGAVVSKWLNSESFPAEDRIQKLAEVCGDSFDELNHIFMLSKKAYQAEKKFRKPHKTQTKKKSFWEE